MRETIRVAIVTVALQSCGGLQFGSFFLNWRVKSGYLLYYCKFHVNKEEKKKGWILVSEKAPREGLFFEGCV